MTILFTELTNQDKKTEYQCRLDPYSCRYAQCFNHAIKKCFVFQSVNTKKIILST